jgi:ATP-dependent RNA helicase DOB1
MVKLCKSDFDENEEGNACVQSYLGLYDFPLSPFQKYAMKAIVSGDHVLICAPTGNGKSMPAEFAIQYFLKSTKEGERVGRRRRVIYTSPIKALSNQKFYDFTQKFPDLKIGILTGDIKVNVDADVLIMTAEILQNALLKKKMMDISTDERKNNACLLSFDMDFENELACIVHDEVHSINLPDRGHVWESIFMLTPPSVQHVMLSATLHSPEKFASWVEDIHVDRKKSVYLSCVKDRIVPLQHYAFVTVTQGLYKQIKNKTLENEIKALVDKPLLIQNEKKQFLEESYFKAKKVVDLLETNRVYIKRPYALNKVCEYMVEHEMLPCACFILSRRQIEVAAREITTNLLEFDSKIPYIVRNECDKYLRLKLPNAHEYLTLPEYDSMMSLLEKGIATHHAGTLPILKELVELMFSKGYVKLLFCSETFSMGLNMPIKTVIFTDVMKFDGSGFRMLHGHEYNQASGRAGRRGLDSVGHVIHLTNLFKKVDRVEYRNMMRGDPQQLTSKFKVDSAFILHRVEQGCRTVTDMVAFAERSMIQLEIDADIGDWDKKIKEKTTECEQMKKMLEYAKTPMAVLERWLAIQEEMRLASNKRKKELEREKAAMVDEYDGLEKDVAGLIKVKE